MGLAAAKNKRKIGKDPNNTKWSRNTESFGQRMLRAQGWQPGEYLGAKNAAHAEWHTEANAAHIRVVLKDDTLGLGAKRNNGDECTGLDAFQHLLGRLNGKSEETLEEERKAREDLKLSLYVEQKFGAIRFVRGGWLVGDQVKSVLDGAETSASESTASNGTRESTETNETTAASEVSEPAPKPTKRKADDADPDEEKTRKKDKKSKKRKTDSGSEEEASGSKDGKEKKSKKSKKSKGEEPAATDSAQSASATISETDEVSAETSSSSESKKSKKEKTRKKDKGKKEKEEKKDKKDKKEKRKKEKSEVESGTETGDSAAQSNKASSNGTASASGSTPAESSVSTPSGSGYSTPVPTGSSRYIARSRFIAQKKMALTDAAALNQIFMIKS
ncbi:hypothetical protein VTJ83DRAFT_2425 [Remersonia thermophila]|uniref:PinX1-related protein 1 n=1 Tax=Remersonia thermophila TaxID=72144 RepID=A0ABR4DIN1_9PEZI